MGCDPTYDDVITNGRAWLKAHPKSVYSPLLILDIAQAYETKWSIGQRPNDQESRLDPRALEEARQTAIDWYERLLREYPSEEASRFRWNLAHLKLGADTAQRRYFCDTPNERSHQIGCARVARGARRILLTAQVRSLSTRRGEERRRGRAETEGRPVGREGRARRDPSDECAKDAHDAWAQSSDLLRNGTARIVLRGNCPAQRYRSARSTINARRLPTCSPSKTWYEHRRRLDRGKEHGLVTIGMVASFETSPLQRHPLVS